MAKRRDKDGLYKREDSPYWWASYTDASGKRVRCSTGTQDRKEGEALLAKWRLGAHQERQWDAPKPVFFEDVMLIFLKATAEVKRSHRDDKIHARQLTISLAGADMRTLTPLAIRQHIQRRQDNGKTNATINRELALLSAAINYYNKEYLDSLPNPTRGRKLKEPEARIRWLTREEAQQLIAAAGQEVKAQQHLPDFIRLALNTGCRANEMLGLEWSRVDMQQRLFYLAGMHTKAGKRRSVPLNNEAYKALQSRLDFREQHCPSAPWVFCNEEGQRIASVKRSFNTACRRAGIDDFRIHDLRHTCAAWLVSAGVPLPEVKELLGHSTVIMTEKYAHLAPDNVRRAVQRLDFEVTL
ncbi:site-specific integrase [Thiorhodococcus mannitoliphagus]|uniref:Site-specific integrase n=1 Tax=Thiorhodococcus mannitoliphagus TaxID=329406 RepID=A0A6P1DRW6_9GAMM|nr:site-specific integrase [Thiorhodococcus mannitoliphagus]NEX19913.1 site-specific integrase [Thiorhodococcus mannitoliphagus]